MRSLLGPILNQPPVPLAPSRSGGGRSLFTGGGTTAGLEAQMQTFMSNGTVNGLVTRTSSAASQVEWHLYRKAKSGKDEDREEVTSHPALDLWNKPNKHMTRQEFVETAQQHLDLTGESPWVIACHERAKTLPLELWPVRPDRMEPDPDPERFLLGWNYRDPNSGQMIPLGLNEVIHLRAPNPLDPYRGCSPIMTLLITLDRAKAAQEWNRNFFKNSAVPGGIIEVEKRLSDDEFTELAMRWNEQHRGVGNAHKVAIIEHGKWRDRAFSIRDMQFTELHTLDRDSILEAFGFPKAVLGIVEDVNRANAETSEYIFAKWLTVPRLERFKGALNNDLLPLYGETARDLEFDYDSPVPTDAEQENAARNSKVAAFKVLVVDCGVSPEDAAEVVGLPKMEIRERAEIPAREQTPSDEAMDASWSRIVAGLVRNAAQDEAPEVDLSAVDEAWTAALTALLMQWTSVVADWIAQLVKQISDILSGGDRTQLAELRVTTATATGVLQDAMLRLGETSARQVVREAAEQDVDLDAVFPARDDHADDATLTTNLLARGLETSAAREAQRLAGPEPDVTAVAEGVRTHLESLSDAEPKRVLGAALHGAVNAGRFATFEAGPLGSLYATEVLDQATCVNCRLIDGRWICNTDDLAPLFKLYPVAGYVECLGRERCRGTVTGVWRPQTGKETS